MGVDPKQLAPVSIEVGLYKCGIQLRPIAWKAPGFNHLSYGFNHLSYEVKNRLQAFAFKCNLYRYIEDHRDDKVDAQIWMMQYQHAQDVRENLLEKLTVGRCTLT
jgi:hypothetical protein